jgi:hypothetical protein
MAAICYQFLPPGSGYSAWYALDELCGVEIQWQCFNDVALDSEGYEGYLYQFAFAVWVYDYCALDLPCCTYQAGGTGECDADIIKAQVSETAVIPAPITVTVTADQIINSLSDMTDEQRTLLLGYLFPDGAPKSLTCPNIVDAIAAGEESCQVTLCEVLNVPTLLDLGQSGTWLTNFAQLQPPSIWAEPVKQIILVPEAPVTLKVDTETKPQTTTFTEVATAIGVLITLIVGEDLLSGCACSIYDLTVPTCDPTKAQVVRIPEQIYPNLLDPLQPYHSGNAFQVIVNMLSQLMEGAGLCTLDHNWNPIGIFMDTINVTPPVPFRSIRIEIVDNPNPARIQWQPPDGGELGGVQRFGKANWLYPDGTCGPVMFLNLNNQIFKAPDDEAVTLQVYLNPDITAASLYQTSNRFPGVTYPLEPSTL